jgi:predicted RNA-binding Zn ribbon-like protein
VPRYDVPNAAPEPLRLVQRFVNTVDHENEREWLGTPAEVAAFFGCSEGDVGVEEAHELREALRALLRANNGVPLDEEARTAVDRFAAQLRVRLGAAGEPELVAGDALGGVLAVVFAAMLDGSWPRLKSCRNCTWAFYDFSRNRSAGWCSMQLCGNRAKTRAYRGRRAAGRA